MIKGTKQKSKGKKKIMANWADEDEEVVNQPKELDVLTEEKLSSVVDFPTLGGALKVEKKETSNKSASKNIKSDKSAKDATKDV